MSRFSIWIVEWVSTVLAGLVIIAPPLTRCLFGYCGVALRRSPEIHRPRHSGIRPPSWRPLVSHSPSCLVGLQAKAGLTEAVTRNSRPTVGPGRTFCTMKPSTYRSICRLHIPNNRYARSIDFLVRVSYCRSQRVTVLLHIGGGT